jgi:hypothetical protein
MEPIWQAHGVACYIRQKNPPSRFLAFSLNYPSVGFPCHGLNPRGDKMRYFQLWASVGLLLAVGAMPGHGQEKKGYKSELYPLGDGYQWRYKATVNDAPTQQVVMTAEKPELYEHKFTVDKKEVPDTAVRYHLKIVSGKKELFEQVAVFNDGVYRLSTADKDITPPLRFLKLPVKEGESWTWKATSENVPLTGTFTCERDKVKVPAGEFDALRVSCPDFQLGAEKMGLDYWFAKDVGIVKQRVRVGKSDVTLELEDFKPGK